MVLVLLCRISYFGIIVMIIKVCDEISARSWFRILYLEMHRTLLIITLRPILILTLRILKKKTVR